MLTTTHDVRNVAQGKGVPDECYPSVFLGLLHSMVSSFFLVQAHTPGGGGRGGTDRAGLYLVFGLQDGRWVGMGGGGDEGRKKVVDRKWASPFWLSSHGGGRTIGPYADSLPLSSQFQGGAGGGVWGRLKGRGAPGPQHIWLKMTPSSC